MRNRVTPAPNQIAAFLGGRYTSCLFLKGGIPPML